MTEMTQEQLAQMSPEQIAEMQKQQCIFCHIISGKVASKKIYEDEKCLAILDINPANPGHVLVLPKKHYSIMPLMPADEIEHLFKTAKKISAAQIRGLKAEGTNIFVANGAAAGQKAPHFMIHIIPRKSGDGITSFSLPKNQITSEDLEKLRLAVKGKVNEQFGIKDKEPVMVDKAEPETVETEVEEEAKEDLEPEGEEEENGPKVHENGDGHESPMFHIPPPEEDEEEPDDEDAGKPDLDTISKLFG
jgi:histidine triad (HIT) family protein